MFISEESLMMFISEESLMMFISEESLMMFISEESLMMFISEESLMMFISVWHRYNKIICFCLHWNMYTFSEDGIHWYSMSFPWSMNFEYARFGCCQ